MKHLVFIINPRSGVDRQKAIQRSIEDCLDKSRFSYEIQYTQYAKHGTELAKAAADKNVFAVVAVGGDGSVNDIAKGLIGTGTSLAIVPKGSGNGMARTMSIPLDERGAITLINTANTIMMDIGYANGAPFISNAGVAFDALISQKFSQSVRRGFKAYSWLVTKHLWTYKVREWGITIDGKPLRSKAFIINVANGRQFGYDFKIAPGASWTDGLFDVVIIRKFHPLLGGLMALKLLRGSILSSRYVSHYPAKEISIYHPELNLIQLDGDAHPSSNKVHFTIVPGALKVLVP